MTNEIERKFLVSGDAWRSTARKTLEITDHLIARFDKGTARIRLCNGSMMLTFKGPRRRFTRSEYHIPVSYGDALSMIAEFSSGSGLQKRRHDIHVDGILWQVDEYMGALAGIMTADVEIPSEDHPLVLPDWAGMEITGDNRFSSAVFAEAVEHHGEKLRRLRQLCESHEEL